MMRKKETVLLFTLLLVLTVSACAPVAPAGSAAGSTPVSTASGAGATNAMPGMGQATAPATGHGAQMGSMAFDAMFIDSMIEHHQGAIAMAQQAQKESQRPEIKQMAESVIRDQQREVEQMQSWRKQWYPNEAPTGGMGMAMGDMQVSSDASKPFDQRFIVAMIAHHQGAVAMAKEAQTKAEHPEIKQLAQNIVVAQEKEIQQMQGWSQQWFGK